MTDNKKRLGLRVPMDLHTKILSKADMQGKTINALCLEIFWKYFEDKEIEISRQWKERN